MRKSKKVATTWKFIPLLKRGAVVIPFLPGCGLPTGKAEDMPDIALTFIQVEVKPKEAV